MAATMPRARMPRARSPSTLGADAALGVQRGLVDAQVVAHHHRPQQLQHVLGLTRLASLAQLFPWAATPSAPRPPSAPPSPPPPSTNLKTLVAKNMMDRHDEQVKKLIHSSTLSSISITETGKHSIYFDKHGMETHTNIYSY